jgi:hypothetical protein
VHYPDRLADTIGDIPHNPVARADYVYLSNGRDVHILVRRIVRYSYRSEDGDLADKLTCLFRLWRIRSQRCYRSRIRRESLQNECVHASKPKAEIHSESNFFHPILPLAFPLCLKSLSILLPTFCRSLDIA